MSVRIRKVGNSDVITVPKELKLDRNLEYEAFVGRHGSITYLPVEKILLKILNLLKNTVELTEVKWLDLWMQK